MRVAVRRDFLRVGHVKDHLGQSHLANIGRSQRPLTLLDRPLVNPVPVQAAPVAAGASEFPNDSGEALPAVMDMIRCMSSPTSEAMANAVSSSMSG